MVREFGCSAADIHVQRATEQLLEFIQVSKISYYLLSPLPLMNAAAKRFEYIEIGRGIAALLVVFFHATVITGLRKYFGQLPLAGLFSFGYAGVDFFFVLSGFIIFYSTAKQHANPTAIKSYIKHRLIRIYPIYWIVCSLILPLSFLMGHPVGETDAVMDFLLLPRSDHPFIIVAWTLRHEMLFYLSFVLFFLNVTLAWAYFMLWGSAIAACNILSLDTGSAFSSLYLNDHNLEFLAGMLVGYYARSNQMMSIKPVYFVLVGTIIFVASGLNESLIHLVSPSNSHYHLIYGVSAALIVGGLAGLQADMKNSWVRIGTFVGRASYSIYLIHFAVLSAVIKLLLPLGLALWLNMVLLILAGVAIGMLLYQYVEAPLLDRIRSRFV